METKETPDDLDSQEMPGAKENRDWVDCQDPKERPACPDQEAPREKWV